MGLNLFCIALLCKSLWKAIFGNNIWRKVIEAKYLDNKDIIVWFRQGSFDPPHGSAIWRSFHKIELFFLKNLAWNFQSGKKILIGLDPLAGDVTDLPISQQLLHYLQHIGIFYWDQVIDKWLGSIPTWKTDEMMGLYGDLSSQWDKVIMYMKSRGIFISSEEDHLIWNGSKGWSSVYVKDIYSMLQMEKPTPHENIFPIVFWKSNCHTKIILFAWLVFNNKNLTWDNLQKRNWCGPTICPIFILNEESNYHIFLVYPHAMKIWKSLANHFGLNRISFPSIKDAFQWWSEMRTEWRLIPLISIWAIWKWRNRALFQDRKESYTLVLDSILSHHPIRSPPHSHFNLKKHVGSSMDLSILPRAYFDGATMNGICACGVLIIPCEYQHIQISWNGGKGSNNKVEAIALVGLLSFSDFLNIQGLHIFGDSMVIIDHVKSVHIIQNINISGWLDRIASIWNSRKDFTIQHIERTFKADALSKEGVSSPNEIWKVSITVGDIQRNIQDFRLPGT